MLRFLSVRHLAVIDALDIEFDHGLTVLTGETGAGKTILVEAIDLLVGGRASADLVRTGHDTATIQAIFERPGGGDVIIRREISTQGRSRAFIDDALATTMALREIGRELVDLHGQHEHQRLLDPASHADVVDTYAGIEADVAALGARFDEWRQAEAALDRLRLDDREKRARLEIATFHLQEIDKVAPVAGEDEQLTAERQVLANADRLTRLSSEAFALLYEGDTAALAALAGVWRRLHELGALDARFAPYLEGRDAIKAGLEDLAFFLRQYAADLDAAPGRLQVVEDRLAALERVKRKHGPALADVIARRAALRQEIDELDAGEARADALVARARDARERYHSAAVDVSRRRQAAAAALGAALERELADLAMPKARVDIRVTAQAAADAWSRRGVDDVECFFSPNPGEDVRPLARIASGGELSRVMLALRRLSGRDAPGRTLIFDEVDAGIGGVAADAVGARLQELSRQYQVLCITHLAPIAARGDAHLHIAKQIRGGRTETLVARLDEAGRELEVARMIAGASLTSTVRASAREMLAARRRGGDASVSTIAGAPPATDPDDAASAPRRSRGRRGG